MQIALERHSAQIVPFAVRAARKNRLTMTDRIQALEWAAQHAEPAGARLTIHARHGHDSPEVGDYIGIYRADDRWAVWGAAREGTVVTVWHGPTGSDLGHFASMSAALAAVCATTIQPWARRRN